MPNVHDLAPETAQMRTEVLAGLQQEPKRFPSHYLYDDRGARLFEQICEVEEYYVTRTEKAVMRQHAADISRHIGARAVLIEPGSGAGEKAQALLAELDEPAAYVPIDVAGEQLAEVAADIDRSYPEVDVVPVCADFTAKHELPLDQVDGERRVVYFPGSTIGNFEPAEARELLRRMAELAGPDGGVLIGVDLKKDPAILEPAYDDAAGVSAAFGQNILVRLNRELGADFDLEQFEYRARYDEARGRIEMALVSQSDQDVTIGETTIRFEAGERAVTEYSYKYTLAEFAQLAAEAGLTVVKAWTDPKQLFSVQYAERRA